MKLLSFATVDMRTGELRRYHRVTGNHAIETGRMSVEGWHSQSDNEIDWSKFADFLRAWIADWAPPEEPGPRPTSPLGMEKAA